MAKLKEMGIKNNRKVAFTFGALIFPLLVYTALTFLSWFIAFANDEGTINETIGWTGHFFFLIFRFPTHYIFGANHDFLTEYYFSLLWVNIAIYSILTAYLAGSLSYLKWVAKRFIKGRG